MRRALFALLLAATMTGCTQAGGGTSTSDFQGNQGDVADAIADFSSNASNKKESKACAEDLSKALSAKIAQGGKSCPDELGKSFDDADTAPIQIDTITVTGPNATAKVYVKDQDKKIFKTWKLVDEDGDWRIDSFG